MTMYLNTLKLAKLNIHL